MPKTRTLDASFWDDPDIANLARDERLLLIGMLTQCADDEGRLLADPGYLRKRVFGYDDDLTRADVQRMRDSIIQHCRNVRLYTVAGQAYIWFANWQAYQEIRYVVKSRLPAYPGDVPSPPQPTEQPARNGAASDTLPQISVTSGDMPQSSEHSPRVGLSSVELKESEREIAHAREEQQRQAFDADLPSASTNRLPTPAPKPSKDEATVAAYDAVYAAYPRKNKIPPNYETGLSEFIGVPLDERRRVQIGAEHYAQSDEVSRNIVMNLDRFIRERHYERWQHAEIIEPARSTPHAPAKSTAAERQRANLADIAAARAVRNGRSDPRERDRGSPTGDSRLLAPAHSRPGYVGAEIDRVG